METQKITPGEIWNELWSLSWRLNGYYFNFNVCYRYGFRRNTMARLSVLCCVSGNYFIRYHKYKKLNANALSLGEALKLGLIIAVISALVYVAYIFIFNYLIDTEFNNKMIEAAETKIAESELPVETKEAQLKMVKMFSSPSVGSLAWIALSMIFGLVYSLIGGLVMKREASND